MISGPAIYGPGYGPGYGRTLIKRDPKPDEERALRDLLRAMTRATLDIARERRAEERRTG